MAYTVQEVQKHISEKDLWVIHEDNVYNISDFVDKHPGGRAVLLQHAGQDVTDLMSDPASHQHSQFALQILQKHHTGHLAGSNNSNNNNKDELIDWSKPLLLQVGDLGKNYFEWVHSPVDRPIHLFENPILEWIAVHNTWWNIPLVWFPFVCLFSYLGYTSLISNPDQVFLAWCFGGISFSSSVLPLVFIEGILSWSLLEYILHRFLFHMRPPENSWCLITLHFLLHGQHHKSPFDKTKLVFPPTLGAIIVYLLHVIHHILLPPALAYVNLAGLMLGYIMYDMTHYYLHHGNPSLQYFKNLRHYHNKHHFIDQQKAFGLSSKIWDYPFQTLIPDSKVPDDSKSL